MAPPGACSTPSASDKFELGKPVVGRAALADAVRPVDAVRRLVLVGFASLRRPGRAARSIAIFAFFAQLVATCYVQAIWIDLSRTFYFERWSASSSGRCCSALFSYALLRGIAESLTGGWPILRSTARGCAKPGGPGASCRAIRIVQRADLMAQILYLVLTVICIFYLIVISIDWYDGVIRLGETFYRQIAIDGRYRDFPIWSFVIPSVVLMAWKTLTVAAQGAGAAGRPLWPRRSRSAGCWATTAAAAIVRMDRSFSRVRPVLPEIVLSVLLIFWAAVMVVTEGAIKLYDGGAGGFVAADGGRWVISTLFWNTQADWFAALAILMAVPYLATIYISLREPLAEPPPDSYTSKW